MDPLSIAASIAGLLSASTAIGKVLKPYVEAARGTPKMDHQVHSSLRAEWSREELKTNIAMLLNSQRDLASRVMNIEDGLDTLTVASTKQNTEDPPACSILDGIEHSKKSDSRSLSAQANPTNLNVLSTDSLALSGHPQSQKPLIFEFEKDLELSRPYRRIPQNRISMDFSFRSSVALSHAWSAFSSLSLSDISNISVIALPIDSNELSNMQHYTCGRRKPAEHLLHSTSSVPVTPAPYKAGAETPLLYQSVWTSS
ncbi:hypothetical protein QBC35DRAFT_553321 [Podospora australis]|uniref:Fungal N-terminal domain-containing protein n=1 Tax=Podospora australis TaxID=1536484 RepID=A0AAN6WRF1_9PEZI|nr:hypothetical protein QBC35DRAFT_553321 [Podospora australis]